MFLPTKSIGNNVVYFKEIVYLYTDHSIILNLAPVD